MIFATGDIHASPERFSTESFVEQKGMTRDDYVIICGDFGLVWNADGENKREKYWLDWLDNKTYTTLFIDGNHENHDRLDLYPVESWHGGKVHFIRPNIIHLMRGEIYDICGKSFFTFGGARSHDIVGLSTKEELDEDYTAGVLKRDDPDFKKKCKLLNEYNLFTRVENESWWRREMPSNKEMQYGLENLLRHGSRVDFIITHDGPSSDNAMLGFHKPDPLMKYFETIKQCTNYGHWLFGHYHVNKNISDKDIVLYDQIIQIE